MIVSDQAFVMLLVENRFRDFTKKELADPARQTEAILAVSAEGREAVDEFADKALAAGGQPANDPIEMDFMYGRSFQDPDRHLWEVVWTDPSAIERVEVSTDGGATWEDAKLGEPVSPYAWRGVEARGAPQPRRA